MLCESNGKEMENGMETPFLGCWGGGLRLLAFFGSGLGASCFRVEGLGFGIWGWAEGLRSGGCA